MGGREVSCGEENLLRLRKDRYRGRDICVHEFAHAIQDYGMSEAERERFERHLQAKLVPVAEAVDHGAGRRGNTLGGRITS